MTFDTRGFRLTAPFFDTDFLVKLRVLVSAVFVSAVSAASSFAGELEQEGNRIEQIRPPPGYTRVPVSEGSFGAWLRQLPLKPGRPPVRLYNGAKKKNQDAHHRVIEFEVGSRDLQQCADAVIRLRAEYLWSAKRREEICFRFTSGHPSRWVDWRNGRRPRVRGRKVTFVETARVDRSRKNFKKYLENVFSYAGTDSLSRGATRVGQPEHATIGDFFIQGGFPGHAVLVVDVAQNKHKERMLLLAQSYMPAQDIHILRGPSSRHPWYRAKKDGLLVTPEWRFKYEDLKRFPQKGCP